MTANSYGWPLNNGPKNGEASCARTPSQARQVIAHVLGPITITVEVGAVLAEPGMDGFDAEDRRGKEGITAADVRDGIEAIRWSAVTKPMGLLAEFRWSNG